MLGTIVLIIMLAVELGFAVFCITTKSVQKFIRSIVNLSEFVLMVLLLVTGVMNWGFRWTMLFVILLIRSLLAGWYLIKRNSQKVKTYKVKYVILSGISSILLVGFAISPAIVFPQFKPVEVTGNYPVETVSYTLTDKGRAETFSEAPQDRNVTIQFWYPKTSNETFPLVVFSHGSFGFRGSNASTFEDLASNGYVVCSIDHTYHAFFTKQTDGEMIIANMDFINETIAVTNEDYDTQKTYELTSQWLKLRQQDMNFVLEEILKGTKQADADEVYQLIDTDKIGLFGHSMGGATAAALGRDRSDIDAVIVVDGTMLGEEIGFENGKTILKSDAYPIPILNLYNEDHYKDAKQAGMDYANSYASANAFDAREIVIKGSGHLNYTDLPLFSPTLARMLGTGEVDSRYCIETTNQIIIKYFNHYLKGVKDLELLSEY
ncbi:MAG: isoform [Herbinix sp.]|jgi:dienelactone hydrolase|nr:isoform [Herbinix sp.]